MINTDTLNLLRLNSVSPHQPGDRNTHKAYTNAHSRTYHFNETWLSAGLLLGNGCHGDSRCSIWGSCCCVFPAPCFLPLWYSAPSIQHSTVTQRGLNPDYASTPNYASIALHPLLKTMLCTGRETSLSVSQGQTLPETEGSFTKYFRNAPFCLAVFEGHVLYSACRCMFCQIHHMSSTACVRWWGGGHGTNPSMGSEILAFAWLSSLTSGPL